MGTQLPHGKGHSTPSFRPTLLWHGRSSQELLSSCCTDHRRVSVYFTMGRASPPSKLSLSMGIRTPSFPVKISPLHRDLDPISYTVPWPAGDLKLNGILMGLAISSGLTNCDRPTERPTDYATRSVTIGRIYKCVHSTTMRYK